MMIESFLSSLLQLAARAPFGTSVVLIVLPAMLTAGPIGRLSSEQDVKESEDGAKQLASCVPRFSLSAIRNDIMVISEVGLGGRSTQTISRRRSATPSHAACSPGLVLLLSAPIGRYSVFQMKRRRR